MRSRKLAVVEEIQRTYSEYGITRRSVFAMISSMLILCCMSDASRQLVSVSYSSTDIGG